MRSRKNRSNGARATKRRAEALIDELKQKFTTMSEAFASDYLSLSAEGDPEGDKSVELFDNYDKKWRAWARLKLQKVPTMQNDAQKRQNILDRFSQFTHKFIARAEEQQIEKTQEIPKATSKEDILNTGKVGIEIMRQALKKIDVNTQAKTVAGVQRRVDELSEENKNALYQVIQKDYHGEL